MPFHDYCVAFAIYSATSAAAQAFVTQHLSMFVLWVSFPPAKRAYANNENVRGSSVAQEHTDSLQPWEVTRWSSKLTQPKTKVSDKRCSCDVLFWFQEDMTCSSSLESWLGASSKVNRPCGHNSAHKLSKTCMTEQCLQSA